ncbi:hypothetical protein [Numidum massiliense]|uniref:hypothetical protein n=1 Tax=Numidum massiliense TaxID=1522315 RepID=UPI0006D53454|nr:hypothetical protein [Numidum massiliense]
MRAANRRGAAQNCFWVDRDGEFAEDVARLSLDDTQLELVTAGNWLMDTVLYAQTFHADRVFDHFERIGH